MSRKTPVEKLLQKKNMEINEAPVKNYCAIGLLERLTQTIKNRVACIKEEKLATMSFNIKYAPKFIIQKLRICKQKTTKISLFEACYGRKLNTPMSVISTLRKLSNLSYENTIHYHLDEDTVIHESIPPDDKWISGY